MKVNTLKITVPGKPVGKQRPKIFRDSHGHTHGTTPEKTRNYEATIRQIFSAAFPDWIPTEDPISLCMMAYFPIPLSWSKKKKALAVSGDLPYQGTPDADNILKCADALNEIAWKDDKQVVVAHCERYYSEQPRLEIEISKWEPNDELREDHERNDSRETGGTDLRKYVG